MIGNTLGVGLYIDADRVYVAQLSRKFMKVTVTGYADVKINQSGADGEDRQSGVREAVKEALKIADVRNRPVTVALPGRESILRYFEIPLIPKREWAQAIKFESQKYLSLDTRQLQYDYGAEADRKSKKVKVSFMAAKKETIADITKLCQQSGLKLRSLEAAPVALNRLFRFEKRAGRGQAHAFVDLRETGDVSIAIRKQKMILVSRDSVVAKSGSGPGEGALPGPDWDAFLTQMRLSLNFYDKNFRPDEVKKIDLFAPSGELFETWARRLQEEVGIPVELNTSRLLPKAAAKSLPGLAVAMGLALKDLLVFEGRQYNLLANVAAASDLTAEEGLSVEEERQKILRIVLVEASAVFAVLFVVGWVLGFKVKAQSDIEERLKKADPVIASIPSATVDQTVETLKIFEKEIVRKNRFLSTLVRERPYWTYKLQEIAKTLPETIKLSIIDYTDNTGGDGRSNIALRIEGAVSPREPGNHLELLNDLAQRLMENELFMQGMNQVKITSIRKRGPKTLFIIDCLTAKESGDGNG